MDVERYLQSKVNQNPACDQSSAKDITIKNNNWILSNTHVDIEKDIGGKTISSPIIRVVGSLKTTDPIAKKR